MAFFRAMGSNGTVGSSVGKVVFCQSSKRKTCQQAGRQSSTCETVSPLSIVSRDLRYLQDHASMDFINTLAPVRDVHEQVGTSPSYCYGVVITMSMVMKWCATCLAASMQYPHLHYLMEVLVSYIIVIVICYQMLGRDIFDHLLLASSRR